MIYQGMSTCSETSDSEQYLPYIKDRDYYRFQPWKVCICYCVVMVVVCYVYLKVRIRTCSK